MPYIDTDVRRYVAAYAVLLTTLAAAGVTAVLLARAAARLTASERARPCAAGTPQRRDCLVSEPATVVQKRHSGDPETYHLETAAGSAHVDEDFYAAVAVGDEVELVSYGGKIVRVTRAGRGSDTGAYTGAVDGWLIFLGLAVTMTTVAALLTVAVHRRRSFEGMVLVWAVVLAPLSTMVCGSLIVPHLRAAVGTFGAAAISCAVLAAGTAALVVWAVDLVHPPVFRRGSHAG
ncbi:hypothetical protein Daura_28295 [Dactylosporangium aurantiacum]|uniref:Uncharacterized protein n=1 Tax=Dactylosporangium aurantiacum TaxID=35754 RepID=A0A9Q9IAI0_9ACTN|nr:hypothetical protein [Dactylosporangium aurantiacum]MDG6106919.1 hypothetical protein [Dactylosporangium aurantiacum]UWZ50718.1 hypothetical protein Daura_28295 [Dactylosporangium aurantiacum]